MSAPACAQCAALGPRGRCYGHRLGAGSTRRAAQRKARPTVAQILAEEIAREEAIPFDEARARALDREHARRMADGYRGGGPRRANPLPPRPGSRTHMRGVIADTNKARYRQRMIAAGRCPHCGTPCAPYFLCARHREYKKQFNRARRANARRHDAAHAD